MEKEQPGLIIHLLETEALEEVLGESRNVGVVLFKKYRAVLVMCLHLEIMVVIIMEDQTSHQ